MQLIGLAIIDETAFCLPLVSFQKTLIICIFLNFVQHNVWITFLESHSHFLQLPKYILGFLINVFSISISIFISFLFECLIFHENLEKNSTLESLSSFVLLSCYEFQILMTDQEGDQLFNDRHLQKIM